MTNIDVHDVNGAEYISNQNNIFIHRRENNLRFIHQGVREIDETKQKWGSS